MKIEDSIQTNFKHWIVNYLSLFIMMYTDTLGINLLQKFNIILFREIELMKPMFIKINKQISIDPENKREKEIIFETNRNLSFNTSLIIEQAKVYFKKANINITQNCGSIRYISYEYKNSKKIKTSIAIHRDFDNIGKPLHTCIFYLAKDCSLIGGNLGIYKLKNYLFFKKFKKIKTIEIKNGSVVVLDSSQYHCPENCGGNGQRNMIIVHFVAEFQN